MLMLNLSPQGKNALVSEMKSCSSTRSWTKVTGLPHLVTPFSKFSKMESKIEFRKALALFQFQL